MRTLLVAAIAVAATAGPQAPVDRTTGVLVRTELGEFEIAVGRLVPPLRCRQVLSNITLFGAEAGHASAYPRA